MLLCSELRQTQYRTLTMLHDIVLGFPSLKCLYLSINIKFSKAIIKAILLGLSRAKLLSLYAVNGRLQHLEHCIFHLCKVFIQKLGPIISITLGFPWPKHT